MTNEQYAEQNKRDEQSAWNRSHSKARKIKQQLADAFLERHLLGRQLPSAADMERRVDSIKQWESKQFQVELEHIKHQRHAQSLLDLSDQFDRSID